MTQSEIKLLQNALDELSDSLNELLKLVTYDFDAITQSIKDHTRQSVSGHFEDQIGEIIHELQCGDLFQQKVEHINQIHSWIQKDIQNSGEFSPQPAERFNHSLLRLNHLQFEAASYDLSSSMDRLYQMFLLNKDNRDAFFRHNKAINNLVTHVKFRYQFIAGLCKTWNVLNVIPLTAALTKLYSSSSERFVMEFYLGDPLIKPEKIIQALRSMASQSSANDLF